jgi:cytochrome b561
MKTAVSYTRTQVALHWGVVLGVALQYVLKDGISGLWEQRLSGAIPNEGTPNIHTIAGVAVLIMVVWRIVLKLRHGHVPAPASEARALAALARSTHLAFYGLLIAMPVSGFLAWFIGLTVPAQAHSIAAKLLLALIVLHVAAALVHWLWFKSGVMARMSPLRIFRRAKAGQEIGQ